MLEMQKPKALYQNILFYDPKDIDRTPTEKLIWKSKEIAQERFKSILLTRTEIIYKKQPFPMPVFDESQWH